MFWERLTTKAFREQVLGHVDTAILPTGSVEAHGQHCPLGTDNIAPAQFAQRVEALYPERLLVMPAIPYGHTWDLAEWPGTLSIPGEVFGRYVAAVGQAAAGWGMANVVILNGHGGNIGPLTTAMEDMAEHGARVVLVNWWLDYREDILRVVAGQGHAGEDETSVMLAMAGSWVQMEDASFNPLVPRYRIKDTGLASRHLRHATTGDGRGGTREKGEQIIALVTERLKQLLEDLWADRLFDRSPAGS
ncbi:MAG: creatininase family protein [Thermaerobacter sp.]|nr:creatininase family protein [Thermaerobacter sp.]